MKSLERIYDYTKWFFKENHKCKLDIIISCTKKLLISKGLNVYSLTHMTCIDLVNSNKITLLYLNWFLHNHFRSIVWPAQVDQRNPKDLDDAENTQFFRMISLLFNRKNLPENPSLLLDSQSLLVVSTLM